MYIFTCLLNDYSPLIEPFYLNSLLKSLQRGHHGENYFIYVSTGIIHSWERGEAVLMLFWFVMSSSVIILMNSFVYRYVHICR